MISMTLMIASPILIAAIGGAICKKAGVVNIALEGLMAIGAVTAAITHLFLETSSGFSIPLALLFASFVGGVFSLLLAFTSVTLKTNQLVSGMGINLLSAGLTVFICQVIFRMDRTPNFKTGMSAGIFGIYPTLWIALVLLTLVWLFHAKITKHRYIAVIISGMLAGLAGACLVLSQESQFTANIINGKGFIALAVVYFGKWMPLGVLGVSVLFALSSNIEVSVLNVDWLLLLPYLFTLIMFAVFSRNQCSTTSVLPKPPISGLEK